MNMGTPKYRSSGIPEYVTLFPAIFDIPIPLRLYLKLVITPENYVTESQHPPLKTRNLKACNLKYVDLTRTDCSLKKLIVLCIFANHIATRCNVTICKTQMIFELIIRPLPHVCICDYWSTPSYHTKCHVFYEQPLILDF